MKSKKMFFCIILILLLTFSQLLIVSADVGNSFSGESSSSGSSGYNSGSSGYSSGGSYSNDYSYSYTPSYNHSYSSGSGSEGDVLLIIVFVVFLGGSFLSWLAKSSGGSQSNNFSTQSANMDIANTGAPSQPQCPEAQIVARIKQSDPNFSESLFKAQAKDVWLTLQEAWEAKDWQSVRNLESEELYKIHSRQLQEYIDMKKTNYMNMQNIHDGEMCIRDSITSSCF